MKYIITIKTINDGDVEEKTITREKKSEVKAITSALEELNISYNVIMTKEIDI